MRPSRLLIVFFLLRAALAMALACLLTPAAHAALPKDEVLEREGAVIGAITFKLQNIFATDTPEENKALFRLANQLHIQTKQSTIEQQLLFRTGDKFSRKKMEESERLLRSRRYLYFVQIRATDYREGLVDIEVSTRDVWSQSPTLNIGRRGGVNSGSVGIEDLNVLGFGKQLTASAKSEVDRRTVALAYTDPQLMGSWWALGASFANSNDGHTGSLIIEQPFYALDTPWAGGVRLRDEKRIDPIYSLGVEVERFAVSQRAATAYMGWSLGHRLNWVQRVSTGFTFAEDKVQKLPAGSVGSSRLAYPWVSTQIVQDDFQKLENFNQIGRTEDINLGWQVSAQLGLATKATGSDRNATLVTGVLTHGGRLSEAAIFIVDAAITGQLDRSRENTALASVGGKYYLRQSPARLLFVSLRADASTHTGLTLGGDNGLRGYPQRYQSGSGRWLFSAEQRLFTDWYPWRLFHVGGAAFFDMGSTTGKAQFAGTARGVLADAGVGLRLGNSRAGFGNVVHIDLAFPVRPRDGISKVQFVVETKRSF